MWSTGRFSAAHRAADFVHSGWQGQQVKSMSEESNYLKTKSLRSLNEPERNLVDCLLKEAGITLVLDEQKVMEMNDGGMGSLYFVHPVKTYDQRSMGMCIAEKQFLDSDNTPILVSLNVDEEGLLFELDIWKADFSKVMVYPTCS